MPGSVQELINLAVSILSFGLVLALWLAGALLWLSQRAARAQKVEERLGLVNGELGGERVLRLWKDGGEATTTVPGLAPRPTLAQRFERLCKGAGWQSPAHTVAFGLVGVLTLLFLMAIAVTGSALAGLGAMGAGMAVFWTYLKQRITKCAAHFERQLADALDLASRSLRAGHPLTGAFRLVADELGLPVGPVFLEICQQQSLGVPFDEALRGAAARSGSTDMRLFATAVVIQLRSGGNLAEMMDRVAAVIRERIRLSGRVRVLTSQTQFSKRVLIAMPFVMFGVLTLVNAEYASQLYTTNLGKVMLVVAAALLTVGGWVMNKMAVLRY